MREPDVALPRRDLLSWTGLCTASLLTGCAAGAGGKAQDEGVTPAEDLMREHGLLARLLLVYEEGLRRIDARQGAPLDALSAAAGIVRTFVEDYHERLEERHLFPCFAGARQHESLVATLAAQHAAGRALTEQITRLTALREGTALAGLGDPLRRFVRMYRPHAAREDTVLFPALHGIVPRARYEELGELFEEEERTRLGKDGFEAMVAKVAGIERALGIDDLAHFTT
jgi:hemerythrin-like domain-containing protein